MAEERSTLWIKEIEGKEYVAEWPESFTATRTWLTEVLNPRTSKWDGSKLSLWLENGNAIYVVGDDFRPDAETVTLHLMYGPDPGPVPGREPRETSSELTAANNAKKVDEALQKMGELMGTRASVSDQAAFDKTMREMQELLGQRERVEDKAPEFQDKGHDGSGFAISTAYSPEAMKLDVLRVGTAGVWRAPFDLKMVGPRTVAPVWNEQGLQSVTPIPDNAAPVSSLTKALMTASTPKMNLLGLNGPIPGSDGMDADLVAQKIVALPGFLDTIYARFKAEQKIEQAAQTPAPIRQGMFYDSYGIGRHINTNVWAPGTFTVPTQTRSTWGDFLTDVAAFLTTIAEASEVFARTKDLPRKVVVQDSLSMAGDARLVEAVGFVRSQPKHYAVRDFFAQEASVARFLANRARTLQGVKPLKPDTDDSADEDDPPRPLTDADDPSEWVAEAHSHDGGRFDTMGGNGEMGGQRE